MPYTNEKIIISGSRIESFQYDKPIRYGPSDHPIKKRYKREKIEVVDEESRERKLESKKRSAIKSGTHVTRLMYANAHQYQREDGTKYKPTFVTLTFAENISDLKEANHAFSNFIKRLAFKFNNTKESFLKYIVVPELQKRGAVHYHAIFFNLDFILKSDLEEVWDEGFAKIRLVDNLDTDIKYVTKYVTKGFESRPDGQKRYFPSKGLFKPKTEREQSHARYIRKNIPEKYVVEKKEYDSQFEGHVKYTKFGLKKGESLDEAMYSDLLQ